MSADNGIYILQTFGGEFRVAHVQGIDTIYGNFSEDILEWNGDEEMIYQCFREAPVFFSLEEALDFADNLSYNYDFLEYGICVITDFAHINFNMLKENYGEEGESDSWEVRG